MGSCELLANTTTRRWVHPPSEGDVGSASTETTSHRIRGFNRTFTRASFETPEPWDIQWAGFWFMFQKLNCVINLTGKRLRWGSKEELICKNRRCGDCFLKARSEL